MDRFSSPHVSNIPHQQTSTPARILSSDSEVSNIITIFDDPPQSPSNPNKHINIFLFSINFCSLSTPLVPLPAPHQKRRIPIHFKALMFVQIQQFNSWKQSMRPSTSKQCLLLLLLLAVHTAKNSFKKSGETIYASSSEQTYRAMVYEQTQARIQAYNELYSEYYTAGHTAFSELTLEEFAATYLGGSMSEPGSASRTFVQGPTVEQKSSLSKEGTYGATTQGVTSKAGLLNNVVPSVFSVDYSQASTLLITTVKDQGACGSCWAFAGIGQIESYFIKYHNLYLDLSEQQMVDCLPAVQSGNAGCGGGYLDSVGYYSTLYPIAQEKYYPYTAVQSSCNNDRINQGRTFQIHSYVYIYDCITLANSLLTLKPIGICGAIDAQWQTYVSGVVPTCGTSVGGHCVLLVGAVSDGTTNVATNYWKIRNSWGVGWGEQGFMRLFRDYTDTVSGLCGFCQSAIYSL